MEHSASSPGVVPRVEPELLVVTCTPDGQVVERNGAWKRVFGTADNPWTRLTKEEQGNVLSAFNQAAHGTLVTNTLLTVDVPERDEPLPVLLNFIPVPGSSSYGEAVNEIQAVTITGEMLAEPTTWTPNQTQRHRMEALGRMTMGIVHDFNNLLSALLGHAELLKRRFDGDGVDPSITESLFTIEQAAVDGATLVEKIQRFIRQENESHFKPVDLPSIIEGCITLTKPYWYNEPRRQGISIDVHRSLQGVPAIMGSPTELREVFVNLILNAVQAMPEGGVISFATRYQPDKGIEVQVADTGNGMDNETKRQIFEPLFTTKGTDGNGMGLTVSYGIIQEHDGSVSVESSVGEGTVFNMLFPPASPSNKVADEIEVEVTSKSARILIVDDEQMVRTVLSKLLQTRGHEVDQAESGAEALTLVESTSYDIIFTDHSMPTMNGKQLARAIRRRWPDLPLVLLTGEADIQTPDHVDLVLGKPFKLDRLQETIRDLVSSA